ncbi:MULTISPECIES: competence/damage-inducible protein A [unclassified Thermotoga]|uniref:competence/damage-inducible protein A n=1 Tax=unclassified Thermotoga TaxID=2631113 RepID=UPI000542A98B|nr:MULTISPECIES: competence/damage-inducible protein A [unclassified Thermotoga]KAF2959817.1 damage-inducible protein CinA [Thermotoga sp. 38H-to]KHC90283.1 competence/damage-inducible protein CinA [Thermotoga sp. Mc24]
MKKAAIITIGSELLEGLILNKNAQFLCQELKNLGYRVVKVSTVGDDLDTISEEVKTLIPQVDLLVLTGGLGPTQDDLTRDAVAKSLNRSLKLDEALLSEIKAKIKKYHSEVPQNIERQALVIDGAEVLDNPVGSAPGQILTVDGKTIILLPGPPRELIPMFNALKDRLRTTDVLYQIVLKYYSIPEAVLEDLLKDILYSQNIVEVATMADHVEGVRLRLTTHMKNKEYLDEMVKKILEKTGEHLYGMNDEKMEEVVVRLLKDRKKTLAVAESCTGGMLSSLVVNVPGASEVFAGGVVAYSNDLKKHILGVREDTLRKHGAVSKECVQEMTEGLKKLTGADICVSISGIAGPLGGTPEKPVGTVFIDIFEHEHITMRYNFTGDRNTIRTRSAMMALENLRKYLKGREKV